MKSSENTDSYHVKNLYLNYFSFFNFIYNIVIWRGVSKIETVSSYREKRAQKLHKLIEEDSHNFQNFFLAIDSGLFSGIHILKPHRCMEFSERVNLELVNYIHGGVKINFAIWAHRFQNPIQALDWIRIICKVFEIRERSIIRPQRRSKFRISIQIIFIGKKPLEAGLIWLISRRLWRKFGGLK